MLEPPSLSPTPSFSALRYDEQWLDPLQHKHPSLSELLLPLPEGSQRSQTPYADVQDTLSSLSGTWSPERLHLRTYNHEQVSTTVSPEHKTVTPTMAAEPAVQHGNANIRKTARARKPMAPEAAERRRLGNRDSARKSRLRRVQRESELTATIDRLTYERDLALYERRMALNETAFYKGQCKELKASVLRHLGRLPDTPAELFMPQTREFRGA